MMVNKFNIKKFISNIFHLKNSSDLYWYRTELDYQIDAKCLTYNIIYDTDGSYYKGITFYPWDINYCKIDEVYNLVKDYEVFKIIDGVLYKKVITANYSYLYKDK